MKMKMKVPYFSLPSLVDCWTFACSILKTFDHHFSDPLFMLHLSRQGCIFLTELSNYAIKLGLREFLVFKEAVVLRLWEK